VTLFESRVFADVSGLRGGHTGSVTGVLVRGREDADTGKVPCALEQTEVLDDMGLGTLALRVAQGSAPIPCQGPRASREACSVQAGLGNFHIQQCGGF
jgi:hypothetical protein